MGSLFNTDRTLLNPKFEGYKLDPIEQDDHVTTHDFPIDLEGPTQSTVSNRLGSFKEVQSRISFNHIAPGWKSNQTTYFDKSGKFVVVEYDFVAKKPHFHSVFDVPEIISSATSSSSSAAPEYPSAKPLDANHWILADGSGRLFVINITQKGNTHNLVGELLSQSEVTDAILKSGTSNGLIPFQLVQAQLISDTQSIEVIISTKVIKEVHPNPDPNSPDPPPRKRLRSTQSTQFQLSRLDLPFPSSLSTSSSPAAPSIRWATLGDNLPIFTRLVPSSLPSTPQILSSLLVVSPSPFIPVSSETLEPLLPPRPKPRDPLPEEIAPIPRPNEDLDTSQLSQLPPPAPKTPLYSWTQTSDSLTIAFLLPSTTPKSHIRITLASKFLSLSILDPPNIELTPDGTVLPKLRIPKFERREWWDGIDASASFWTWEKEGEKVQSKSKSGSSSEKRKDGGEQEHQQHFIGVLTLYLEKAHEQTRWTHVFSESQPSQAPSHAVPIDATHEQDDNDNSIPETQDPSELLASAEALEKYTASLVSGEDASGLGLGRGLPSLATKEMDESVDEDVGRRVVLSWVGVEDGRRVDLAGDFGRDGGDGGGERGVGVGQEWPLELLSVPLPLSGPPPDSNSNSNSDSSEINEVTLVGKHDVDGLLFTLSSPPSMIKQTWTHTSTYPALSFVLASKRDTRFVFHISSRVVLAFESGASASGFSGNVYIYRGSASSSSTSSSKLELKSKSEKDKEKEKERGREKEKDKPKWNKQAVLRASGHGVGALLGIVGVSEPDSELNSGSGAEKMKGDEGIVILALCEKGLVVLSGVI